MTTLNTPDSKVLLLCASGFGLVAVSYGFARFAFGLFLPRIGAELSMSSTVSGFIAGGSFVGYCVAIILAALLTDRIGARAVALGAALVAAVGMFGMAFATSSVWLALSVLVAGLSSGLASPPLAAAVARIVAPDNQGNANTVINAGTSGGVALSGLAALWMGSDWRLAFMLLAASALVVAGAVWVSVPVQHAKPAAASRTRIALSHPLRRLIVAAFLVGASSAAVWTFGSALLAGRLGEGAAGAGLLWIAIGCAGIAGAAAGALIARIGIDWVHRVSLGVLAAGVLLVGLGGTPPAGVLLGGVLFGAAYLMVTGVYLVWGTTALPDRPATGVMIGFLTMAIGQAVGSPVFGWVRDTWTADAAVGMFAGVALAAALCSHRAQSNA